MKQIILLITVLNFNFLQSQITITQNDLINEGQNHEVVHAIIDSFNFDPTTTGANHYWDFSTELNPINLDTVMSVNTSQTPFAYQLYFNNFLLYPDHYASYALKGDNFVGFGQMDIKDKYDYYAIDNSSLRLTGYGAKLNSVPTSVKYDTIDTVLSLPLSYGMSDSSKANYLITIPTLGTYGQWIKRKVVVDGWGTIKTPHNEYPAIRVKSILYQTDTIYVDQFSFSSKYERPLEYYYEWYAKNEKIPVMSVKIVNSIINEVTFKNDIQATLQKTSTKSLSINPNPLLSYSILELPSEPRILTIYDVAGNKVREQQVSGTTTIERGDLTKGVYVLEVRSESETYSGKLIVE